MKGVKMIVTGVAFKPRSKARILKELKKDPHTVKSFGEDVLKQLAAIAHEFDCMVRDTSTELMAVNRDYAKLILKHAKLEAKFRKLSGK